MKLDQQNIKLQLLSENDIARIHDATVDLLTTTGVMVDEPRLLNRLAAIGAEVDESPLRVRFSPRLLGDLVSQAPKQFTWHGQDSHFDMQLGQGKVYFGATFGTVDVLESDGVKRPATFTDAENAARLVDLLSNVSEGSCLVLPQDVPSDLAHLYALLATLKHSRKPLRGRVYGSTQARISIAMAQLVAGGTVALRERPTLLANLNTVSPLAYNQEQLEALWEYAGAGLPISISPAVQAGATGPVTLAGTIVQHNAETLSGIAMVQAVNPGNPVLYGQVSSIMDMRTGTFSYGAIEHGMLNVAQRQLAQFYGLPTRGDGGFSDSKTLDCQAGFESALNLLMAALAGHDYIFGAVGGGLDSTLTISLEKLVIDDEIAGMIRRVLAGIEVTPETMALGLIKMGPAHNFLGEQHTRTNLRREHFLPELADRHSYLAWQDMGAKDIRDRAKEKVKRLLADPAPPRLPEAMTAEMENLIMSALDVSRV